MKNGNGTLLALFVLAIALLVWRGCAPRLTPQSNVDTPTASAPALAGANGFGDEATLAVAAGGTTKTSTAPMPASTPRSLVPPIRAQRLDDYANSRDLQQFIDNLRAAADAGDAEAAALISKAHDECFPYAVKLHTGRDLETNVAAKSEPARSIAAAQQAIEARRCRSVSLALNSAPARVRQAIESYRKKAREGNDVGSLFWGENLKDLKLSAEDANDLLRRLAGSGNVEAVELMAWALAAPDEDEDGVAGPYSGSPIDHVAWMLVSCDLGRDCEPNGRRMRQHCLMFSQCIAGSYRDVLRYYVATSYQFDEALKKERQILDLLARGALDELFPLRPKQD